MSQRVFAAIEAVALALWIGACAVFAFVFAPIAFRIVGDLDRFAALTAAVLGALGVLGLGCGAVAIVAAGFRARDVRLRRGAVVRMGLILAMLALVAYEDWVVIPKMAATARTFHAPFAAVAKNDPRRVRYDAEHRESGLVYGAALLLGLVAVTLAAGTGGRMIRRILRRRQGIRKITFP